MSSRALRIHAAMGLAVLVVGVPAVNPNPLTSPGARVEALPEQAYSAHSANLARQFDFWLGEWDVRRIRPNPDGTAEELGTERALVYPFLDGTGVAAFRQSSTAKGLSLFHADPGKRRWKELDVRAEGNRVFLERYAGTFRHGRGTLPRIRAEGDTTTAWEAHVFSDITPFSLRWDLSRTPDSGRSWETHEVREFDRTALEARKPMLRDFAPPEIAPGRCDDRGFRYYEYLIGRWGTEGATFEASAVLDGCGVIGVLRRQGLPEEVFLLTFEVTERRWFTIVLRVGADDGVYSGTGAWYDLAGEAHGELQWLVASDGSRSFAEAGATLGLFRGRDRLEFRRLVDQERR